MMWQPLECQCQFTFDVWESPREFEGVVCSFHEGKEAIDVFNSYKAAFAEKHEALVELAEIAKEDPTMLKEDGNIKDEYVEERLDLKADGTISFKQAPSAKSRLIK